MALDFPSNPVNGQVYGNFYWDSSMSAWRASGTSTPVTPAGIVSQYMGTTAPNGYLLCTGQSVSTVDYPALFAVIGYTYGGSGGSFTIPNLQGRVPVGKNSGTFATLGATGGEESHTLTLTEMPSHNHTVSISDPGHNHTQNAHNHGTRIIQNPYGGISAAGGSTYGIWGNYGTETINATATNNASTTGITATSSNNGSGVAHNILQPYIVVNYIIKT